MAIFKATVMMRIPAGSLVFWWELDGGLRSKAESPRDQPVGVAQVDLFQGQVVEITEGAARLAAARAATRASKPPVASKFNKCGRYHLGRCCINGTRNDGSVGYTCDHCGEALTQEQRSQINESFQKVVDLLAPWRAR